MSTVSWWLLIGAPMGTFVLGVALGMFITIHDIKPLERELSQLRLERAKAEGTYRLAVARGWVEEKKP